MGLWRTEYGSKFVALKESKNKRAMKKKNFVGYEVLKKNSKFWRRISWVKTAAMGWGNVVAGLWGNEEERLSLYNKNK